VTQQKSLAVIVDSYYEEVYSTNNVSTNSLKQLIIDYYNNNLPPLRRNKTTHVNADTEILPSATVSSKCKYCINFAMFSTQMLIHPTSTIHYV
jgi:hypothetical protein